MKNIVSIQSNLVTRNNLDLSKNTNNIYESIIVISKRARQIAVAYKTELTNKLDEFASTTDNLEEIFENKEQIEISKFYESLPKPTTIATEEFLSDELNHRTLEMVENTSNN